MITIFPGQRDQALICVSIALVFLFAHISTLQSDKKSPSHSADVPEIHKVEDAEEYVVYGVVLSTEYSNPKIKQFVINSKTVNTKEAPSIGLIGGLTYSGAKRPEVEAETAADFDAKAEKPSLLEMRFGDELSYVLASNDELQSIFREVAGGKAGDDGWARFYKKYPDSAGIIVLSRVGFNSKKNQALIYIANQRGLLGGNGMFFVLAKGDQRWKVVKSVMMWIS